MIQGHKVLGIASLPGLSSICNPAEIEVSQGWALCKHSYKSLCNLSFDSTGMTPDRQQSQLAT